MSYTFFISQTLEKASQFANQSFGKVTGTTKTDDNNQVLTETDLEIGHHIVGQISTHYPDHNIIDEEAGVIDKNSEFTWVVDPIDGTSNFANGIPTYGIMIGLLHKDQPIAGGVALPLFREIYTAEKGRGAQKNGVPIHVTSQQNLLSTLVAYGIDGHQEAPQMTIEECSLLAQIILNVRNLRSSNSAFDVAMLAVGNYGGSLNRTSKIWDNIAPHILVEEAGGKYTDFFGQPMNYQHAVKRSEENFTFCAAPQPLHEQLQKIIREHTG